MQFQAAATSHADTDDDTPISLSCCRPSLPATAESSIVLTPVTIPRTHREPDLHPFDALGFLSPSDGCFSGWDVCFSIGPHPQAPGICTIWIDGTATLVFLLGYAVRRETLCVETMYCPVFGEPDCVKKIRADTKVTCLALARIRSEFRGIPYEPNTQAVAVYMDELEIVTTATSIRAETGYKIAFLFDALGGIHETRDDMITAVLTKKNAPREVIDQELAKARTVRQLIDHANRHRHRVTSS